MNKKRNVFYICLFSIMLLGISISYSLLISKLNIGGSGKISKNSWNIYFENINVKEGSVDGNIDNISETGLSFDLVLNKPGDFLEFSVDVVNAGTLDAMVENIILSDISNYENIINYEVKYSDNDTIEVKDKLSSGEVDTLLIRVEYKRDIIVEDLVSEDINIDFSFEIEYVQDDGSGKKRNMFLADIFGDDIRDGGDLVLNKEVDKKDVGVYKLNNVTFFRGNGFNNNVVIDNYCFSVIIQSDGIVKLLYNGTATDNKCNNDKNYVETVMYDAGGKNDNYAISNLRASMLNWHVHKFNQYDDYLVTGYCNDTRNDGTNYNTFNRFNSGEVDFSCTNTFPDYAGVLTVDDVMLIGYGVNGGVFSNSLDVRDYLLMSPYSKENDIVSVFYIDSDGNLGNILASDQIWVRPVIQLRDNMRIIEGEGTLDKPYILNFNS